MRRTLRWQTDAWINDRPAQRCVTDGRDEKTRAPAVRPVRAPSGVLILYMH